MTKKRSGRYLRTLREKDDEFSSESDFLASNSSSNEDEDEISISGDDSGEDAIEENLNPAKLKSDAKMTVLSKPKVDITNLHQSIDLKQTSESENIDNVSGNSSVSVNNNKGIRGRGAAANSKILYSDSMSGKFISTNINTENLGQKPKLQDKEPEEAIDPDSQEDENGKKKSTKKRTRRRHGKPKAKNEVDTIQSVPRVKPAKDPEFIRERTAARQLFNPRSDGVPTRAANKSPTDQKQIPLDEPPASGVPNKPSPQELQQVKLRYAEFCQIEDELSKLKRSSDPVKFKQELKHRKRLALLGLEILEKFPIATTKYDLETRIWRGSCYAVIEFLRSTHSDTTIVDIAVQYLDEIEKEVFNPLLGLLRGRKGARIIGYTGDISRYKANFVDKASAKLELSKAERKYAKASFLVPSAGLYQNQLALIASLQSRALFAVYYYLRALNVRDSFASAKESLLLLLNKQASAKSPTSKSPTDYVAKVAAAESLLLKLVGMLYSKISVEMFEEVHGSFLKSFNGLINEPKSKAGSDKPSRQSLLLIDASQEGSVRWWLVIAVMLVIVASNYQQVDTHLAESPLGKKSIQLILGLMESILSSQKSRLHADEDTSTDNFVLDAGFVFIEVAFLWMVSHFRDGVNVEEFRNYAKIWSDFAIITNYLVSRGFDTFHPDVDTLLRETLSPIDWILRGIFPFKDTHTRHIFDKAIEGDDEILEETQFEVLSSGLLLNVGVPLQFSLDLAKPSSSAWIRLTVPRKEVWRARALRIVSLAKMISEVFPFFTFQENLPHFAYNAKATEIDMNDIENERQDQPVELDEDGIQVIDFNEFANNGLEVNVNDDRKGGDDWFRELEEEEENGEFDNLKLKKETLFKLFKDGNQPAVEQTKLEIAPGLEGTALVFDTNCFMSDYELVSKIVASEKYLVIVPLVVITELDGLSQGDSARAKVAASAITYLESIFKPPLNGGETVINRKWIKLQTGKGTNLTRLTIRTEVFGSNATNDVAANIDEVVLQVAKNQQNRSTLNVTEKYSPVVLITDDGNLRLRANALKVDSIDFSSLKKIIGVGKGKKRNNARMDKK
ncbi:Smg-6, nonsense mediated mRNA decay factor [Nowakowskiella sp. JEL0407]|nr:Smg-6, nonsense mediated mRNA decay factor [Nowakowskiella sp. JEL0407]